MVACSALAALLIVPAPAQAERGDGRGGPRYLLDRVLAVLGLRGRDHRAADDDRLLADEPVGWQVAPGGVVGRRAVCLERGVVPVDLVEVDHIRVAIILEDVEAQA